MDLIDLFAQTTRLLAENRTARRRLGATLRDACRSLSRRPDYRAAARDLERWAERRGNSCRPEPSPDDPH